MHSNFLYRSLQPSFLFLRAYNPLGPLFMMAYLS